MLKHALAATITAASIATPAIAGGWDLTTSDISGEEGSADMCIVDAKGYNDNRAAFTVPVASLRACFDLTKTISGNVVDHGDRRSYGIAMLDGSIVNTYECYQASPTRNGCKLTR